VFDNKDFFFTPGTFGRLRLYGGLVDVVLVPDSAVVSDQAQKILLTVGADNKVVPKPVTLGAIAFGLRAVTGGVTTDDKVIIGGLANPFVRPGATVQPTQGEIKLVDAAAPDSGMPDTRPPAVKASSTPTAN
jgi:hypothetical protein